MIGGRDVPPPPELGLAPLPVAGLDVLDPVLGAGFAAGGT
jgi:hypothetical protein